MFKRARWYALTTLLAAAVAAGSTGQASASERDKQFFKGIEGEWSGPGEIIAGKYKGTKFVCRFKGQTPDEAVGMSLDGGCRVGVFTQAMTASVERKSGHYTGTFLDGADGKGLDVVGGKVTGKKVVFSLNRNALDGAMLAHLTGNDTMSITVSVRVESELIPVIGVNLKRVDGRSVGSVATR